MVRGMLAKGNHLVTRVKSNSVAYFPAPPQPSNRPRGRGRPKKYGNKILVAALLEQIEKLQQAPSPVYGEQGVTLSFRSADLFWCPVGILVRFVAVFYPRRGTILLMSTDMTLSPLDNHPHRWPAIQNRTVLQAGSPPNRRLYLVTSGWRP